MNGKCARPKAILRCRRSLKKQIYQSTPEQFAAWLSEAGGPTEPESIGFSAEDAEMALHFGPYMRNRFMIARLAQILDMM